MFTGLKRFNHSLRNFGSIMLGVAVLSFGASNSSADEQSKTGTSTVTINGSGSSSSSSSTTTSSTTSKRKKTKKKDNSWFNWNKGNSYTYSTSNGSHQEKGSGNITSEVIKIEKFTGIVSNTFLNIEVTIGPEVSATLEIDDNLHDRFELEVSDGDLLVSSSGGSYSTRFPAMLYLTTPSLDYLELGGSGNVDVIDLKGKEFTYRLGGSGNLSIEGEIGMLEIELNGSGNVDTRDCRAEEAFVNLNGSGEARVTGTRLVDARLAGSGNIHVYGKPSRVRKSEVGSGNIYVH